MERKDSNSEESQNEVSISGISFFDHDDFDFARDKDEDLKEEKAILENSISLIILNKKIYRDQKVKGFVKICVRNSLPRGHIEMKCESILNLSIRKNFEEMKATEIISEYKGIIKPVSKRKPFYTRVLEGFKIRKFSKKNNSTMGKAKIVPAWGSRSQFNGSSFLRRLGRARMFPNGRKQRMVKMNKTSYEGSTYRGLAKGIRTGNSPVTSKRSVKYTKKNSIVSDSSSSDNFEFEVDTDIGDLLEKSYLLKSQIMTLFSLREGLSQLHNKRSVLLIPFEVQIPNDMPISFSQDLNLIQTLDILSARKNIISNRRKSTIINRFLSKKSKFEPIDENQEKVSIEHKLIVYFVSHEKKRQGEQVFNSMEMFVKEVNKISSEAKFQVYEKMKNGDFEKFIYETKFSAKYNRKKFRCCGMGLIKSKSFFTLNISMDRLKFRNKDSSINFVISYPNVLLNVYDYIDVILVCTTTVKDQEITNPAEYAKRIIIDCKPKEQKKSSKPFTMLLQNLPKPKKMLKGAGNSEKNATDTTPGSRPKTSQTLKTKKDMKEEVIQPAKDQEKKIETIIYTSSLDILGKRKLKSEDEMKELADNNDRTELVHRINLRDIELNLQTVHSEKISIDYKLKFYASVGPLSFTKKIAEIPLTFISIPIEKDLIADRDISLKFSEIYDKVPQTKKGFVLPFARVGID